jgi:hypothetical protein
MRRINLSALEDDQPVAAAIIERSRDQNGVGTGSARSVNIAYLLSGIPMSALGRCCRRSRRLGKTSEPHSFEAVVNLQVSKAHFDTLTFVT